MKISNLHLFYISQIMTSFYFWLAIAIPYLNYRGLTPADAFSLISIYNFFGVLFEYPTGVVGDKYGYKKMLILSNFLTFFSMLILAQKGGYWWYLAGLTILALGSGFLSGNDVGLLKSLSTNIKRDTANYHSNTDFALFVSSVLGGILSRISFEFALYVSASMTLLANIPMYFVSAGGSSLKATTYKKIIKESFLALKSKKLLLLLTFSVVLIGFLFTIKSIFGGLGNYFGLDISIVGLIIGFGSLARSIASRIYARKQSNNIILPVLAIPFIFFAISLFPYAWIVIAGLLSIHFISGYITPKIDGDLHELVSDNIRASVFSLRRLLMRLAASLLLVYYGVAIGKQGLSFVFINIAAIFIIAIVISWKYLNNRFPKNDLSHLAVKDI